MFCPNCGANNPKKQNYCRFCGLNLQETTKSLMNQIVFGEDSKRLQTLRPVKRVVDFTSTVLVGALFVGAVAFLFFDQNFGKDLMKVSLGILILFQIVQGAIRYLQRQELSKVESKRFGPSKIEQSESKETAKLLEQKPFEPVPSVIENSTELFPLENKSRNLE